MHGRRYVSISKAWFEMLGSLLSKAKSSLLTLIAVFFVLIGVYSYGGHVARRALQEKTRQEENQRLKTTVDVTNETAKEIRAKDASDVHRELHDKWLRD